MAKRIRQGLGWLPELLDVRDFRPEHENDKVAGLLAATGGHAAPRWARGGPRAR